MLGDPFLVTGVITSSSSISRQNEVHSLVVERYDHIFCDVSEPVTPTSVNDIAQRFSLMLTDEANTVIFDCGASISVSNNVNDFVEIHPLSLDSLSGLSERTQVKGEGQ
eukprot:2511922-Ditylum_brightwellii.AAC.1